MHAQVLAFGFEHIARVEVVTSHRGCRHQGWHIDAMHGITVIFPLCDMTLQKGPTQLDFTTPFNALREGSGKVKRRQDPLEQAYAAIPRGSVVLFNANVSHRGTANISTSDRPVLVLDCSLPCPAAPTDLWNFRCET
jgi:ectoine hydroxylase-related dioxygenase (phytanoyl-CoA dioxygenase family)